MATVSFDKNIVVKEPEAVKKLIDILSDTEESTKPIDKKLASEETMKRGEKLLKRCLSHSKKY